MQYGKLGGSTTKGGASCARRALVSSVVSVRRNPSRAEDVQGRIFLEVPESVDVLHESGSIENSRTSIVRRFGCSEGTESC